jgi:carbon monoxide dehydrogenase subunit G
LSANAPSTSPPQPESPTGEPLLVFVHIRKTAGKTLRQILYRQYSRPRTRLVRNFFVAPEISLNVVKDLAAHPAELGVVHGHILFWPDIEWPDETRFLTLLRDPVERVISHYFWLRARNSSYRKSLAEAVMGGGIHDNLQTRVLAASMPPFGETTDEMLETAVKSLDRLTVVGLTERFDESLVLATRVLGWRRMLYRRENVTPDKKATENISDKLIDLIKSHNALDLELYETAVKRFEQDVANQGDAFPIEVAALKRANELAEATEEDAPLDPLPSTIAGPNGSPSSELDLRELLIEAQAELLRRDAAIERLTSGPASRPSARAAQTRRRAGASPGERRKAGLETAIEKAQARLESTRKQLRSLEKEGPSESPAKQEALRTQEAMIQKRLEGFERRRGKLEGRLRPVGEPPRAEPEAAGEVDSPGDEPERPKKAKRKAGAHAEAQPAEDPESGRVRTTKIEGTQRFDNAPPQLVWDALDRPDQIAKLIPAVDSFDIEDENRFTANVKVPLRPGSPLRLRCEKYDQRPPEHGRLTVAGKGAGAAVKIEATFDLSESGGGTDMKWDLEVSLSGRVGPTGPRVLQVLVRRQVKNLFAALQREVTLAREAGK